MYERFRRCIFILIAAVCVAGTALSASPAHAYHNKGGDYDFTTRTLSDGRVLLNYYRLQYGLFKGFTVGTYYPLWFLRTFNAHAKWRFWDAKDWDFSVRVGVYRLDLGALAGLDALNDTLGVKGGANLLVIPSRIMGSYRFNKKWSLNLGLVNTFVRVTGDVGEGAQGSGFRGEAAVSNSQLVGTLEWRSSKVTAYYLRARTLLFQEASAAGGVRYATSDGFTTVDVNVEGSSDALNFEGAGALIVGALFSWKYFHLRLGVGGGSINIPIGGAEFVTPQPFLLTDIDFYWTF